SFQRVAPTEYPRSRDCRHSRNMVTRRAPCRCQVRRDAAPAVSLSGLGELEQTAGLVGVLEAVERRIRQQVTGEVHHPVAHHPERGESVEDGRGTEYTVGVEADALASNRNRKVQTATWLKDPDQLPNCFLPPIWVDRVPVSAKPDVLDRVKARKRVHRVRG